MTSSHEFKKDKRNNNIFISINNKYYLRKNAKISVFDSGFLLGDGVWTSLRLHNSKLLFLKDHLNRLYQDSKTIGLKIHKTKKDLKNDILKIILKNKMSHNVHIRIVITRGIKSTPYQDPAFTISKPTIVIIPEYKIPNEIIYKKGLTLKTVNIIRGPSNVQDPRLNTLSKLNCILACIEAKKKKGDEALMFDINGNISTNNSTHFFYVKNKNVYTSVGKYCVRGITRNNIINLCRKNKIKVHQKNFKLNEVLKADEAFITGTFSGVIPIKKINDKKFKIKKENITYKIINLYKELINSK